MSKKNKKRTKTGQCSDPDRTSAAPVQISAEELQHLIAEAIVQAEDIKAKRDADKKAAERAEWQKAIGYDETKTGIRGVCNKLVAAVRVLFVHKKYIEGDQASVVIIQNLTAGCFYLFKIILDLVAVLLLAYSIAALVIPQMSDLPWWLSVLFIVYALLLFVVSRAFRMAGVEMSKMEDRSDLYAIFSAMVSFISMVVAIIAVVKGA